MAQTVNNLPEIQETQIRTLGWKDTLEKEMATHSNILVWRIHGQRSWATVHGYVINNFLIQGSLQEAGLG